MSDFTNDLILETLIEEAMALGLNDAEAEAFIEQEMQKREALILEE